MKKKNAENNTLPPLPSRYNVILPPKTRASTPGGSAQSRDFTKKLVTVLESLPIPKTAQYSSSNRKLGNVIKTMKAGRLEKTLIPFLTGTDALKPKLVATVASKLLEGIPSAFPVDVEPSGAYTLSPAAKRVQTVVQHMADALGITRSAVRNAADHSVRVFLDANPRSMKGRTEAVNELRMALTRDLSAIDAAREKIASDVRQAIIELAPIAQNHIRTQPGKRTFANHWKRAVVNNGFKEWAPTVNRADPTYKYLVLPILEAKRYYRTHPAMKELETYDSKLLNLAQKRDGYTVQVPGGLKYFTGYLDRARSLEEAVRALDAKRMAYPTLAEAGIEPFFKDVNKRTGLGRSVPQAVDAYVRLVDKLLKKQANAAAQGTPRNVNNRAAANARANAEARARAEANARANAAARATANAAANAKAKAEAEARRLAGIRRVQQNMANQYAAASRRPAARSSASPAGNGAARARANAVARVQQNMANQYAANQARVSAQRTASSRTRNTASQARNAAARARANAIARTQQNTYDRAAANQARSTVRRSAASQARNAAARNRANAIARVQQNMADQYARNLNSTIVNRYAAEFARNIANRNATDTKKAAAAKEQRKRTMDWWKLSRAADWFTFRKAADGPKASPRQSPKASARQALANNATWLALYGTNNAARNQALATIRAGTKGSRATMGNGQLLLPGATGVNVGGYIPGATGFNAGVRGLLGPGTTTASRTGAGAGNGYGKYGAGAGAVALLGGTAAAYLASKAKKKKQSSVQTRAHRSSSQPRLRRQVATGLSPKKTRSGKEY